MMETIRFTAQRRAEGRELVPPLRNASNGYVWAWPSGYRRRRVAHLVELDYLPSIHTLCSRRQRREPRTIAFQVGGYSAIPCGVCLQKTEGG